MRSQESSASNGARFGFETKKLWPFEDELRKAKAEIFLFRSQAPISKGVSQMRNHPLAHECHFAAQYAHFAAVKWAAKIPLLREIHPRCGNDLQASKMGCDLLFTRSLSLHFLPPKTIKSHSYQLRAPVEETMPFKENTITEAKVLMQPPQEATTDALAPQDPTIT